MLIKFVLRMFDGLGWLIRLLGADYAQFRAILETKLTLDGRRPMTGFHQHKKGQAGNAFVGAMVFYVMIGVVIGIIFNSVRSLLVGLTFVHTMTMSVLAMSVIADFSSVLLDTTDNAILQPRPIGGRTILLARIAHIAIYLGLLALSLTLATLAVGTAKVHFLFPLVFAGTLACSMTLVVFLASLFYLVALRLTDGEKLRDIILYFQIAMSIGVIAAYQLLPRLMNMTKLQTLSIENRWWVYIYPPAWMAAPVDLLFSRAGWPQMILSCEAIVIPILGLLFVVRVLAPRFNRALATMEDEPSKEQTSARTIANRQSVVALGGRWISRNPVTRAAFELVWRLCSRDRQLKLRTYPNVAFIFVFPVPILMSDRAGFKHALRELPGTQRHLFILYISSILLSSVILQLRYSDKWQASWIYESLPIRRPGELLLGALWAVVLRFLLPAFLLISAVLLMIWGLRILPDIALALCVTLLTAVIQAMLFGNRLPFSEGFSVTEGSGRFMKSVLFLLLPAGLGGLHYALTLKPPAVLVAIPVVLLLTAFSIRRYAGVTWAELGER